MSRMRHGLRSIQERFGAPRIGRRWRKPRRSLARHPADSPNANIGKPTYCVMASAASSGRGKSTSLAIAFQKAAIDSDLGDSRHTARERAKLG